MKTDSKTLYLLFVSKLQTSIIDRHTSSIKLKTCLRLLLISKAILFNNFKFSESSLTLTFFKSTQMDVITNTNNKSKLSLKPRHYIKDNLPKLICLAQSLCLYRSTSSAISSSVSGSPRTRFLSSSNRTRSTSFGANAVVPVHFLSRRPGPNGENRFGSRNPMGSTAGLFSEYEYLKSNGRSDFSGSLFVFELGTGGFCCVLGFWGFWRFGENGGSSSMYSEEE